MNLATGKLIVMATLCFSMAACSFPSDDEKPSAEGWELGGVQSEVVDGKEVRQIELSYCLNHPETVENVKYYYHLSTTDTLEMRSLLKENKSFQVKARLYVFKKTMSLTGRSSRTQGLMMIPVTYFRFSDVNAADGKVTYNHSLRLTEFSARQLSMLPNSRQHFDGEVLMSFQTTEQNAHLEYVTSLPGFHGDLNFKCKAI